MNENSSNVKSESAVIKEFLSQPKFSTTDEIAKNLSVSKEYKTLQAYKCDDGGLAKAWLSRHGESWIYVTGVERWYFWTGKHWNLDVERNAERDIIAFLTTVNTIAGEAVETARKNKSKDDLAEAFFTLSKVSSTKVSGVLEIAKSLRSRSITTVNQGNLINLNNGTLNLDTFTLQPHKPEDFMDYCMSFDYDETAKCPTWEYFQASSLVKKPLETGDTPVSWQSDKEMAMLLDEFMGICLTNITKYEKMLFLRGEGGNGKSTIIHVLTELMKPFAVNVDFDHLGKSGNYDLSKLPGKRVAFATESETDGTLSEKWLKILVSNRPIISARAIYGDTFEFESQAKVIWAMNDAPRVRSSNNAIWRRLSFMPLYRQFEDKDKDENLWDKLDAELPGILNRLLDGLKRVRAQGFTVSETCESAKWEYQQDSSSVVKWMRECCEESRTANKGQFGQSLLEHYVNWCEKQKFQPMGGTKFFKTLSKQIPSKRTERGVQYALNVKESALDDYEPPAVKVVLSHPADSTDDNTLGELTNNTIFQQLVTQNS